MNMENKENILCMLFILAMVCSCNSKVDPELIYGYWACNDTVMSLKPSQPIGPKLDLFSLQEAWIDPVISDTIYYFNSCKVQNDTLVLQDEDKIFKYRIKELSDSRSEEHTSELQSRQYLVCRLLLEKTNHAPP